MNDEKKENNRLATGIVIAVSLAGIFYFGYRAISENLKKNPRNPFAYDIENFKKSAPGTLNEYAEVQQITLNAAQIYGIAIGPDDRVYVSADEKVSVYNKNGGSLSVIKTAGSALCLAVDGNHDLYLGMTEHIEVYDGKGMKKAHWDPSGEKTMITSIAISKRYVFAADAGRRVAWKYSKTGRKLSRIGLKDEARDIPGLVIPGPYFDAAVDADGFLWLVNAGRHSLENYTLSGDLRSSWGEYAMNIEGFCGCCNPTHIAVLADGSFVTSEKGIPRVKIYNRLGKFVSLVAGPERFVEGTVGLDLAVDAAQRIYVLDPVKRAVRIFMPGFSSRFDRFQK